VTDISCRDIRDVREDTLNY